MVIVGSPFDTKFELANRKKEVFNGNSTGVTTGELKKPCKTSVVFFEIFLLLVKIILDVQHSRMKSCLTTEKQQINAVHLQRRRERKKQMGKHSVLERVTVRIFLPFPLKVVAKQ